MYTIKQISDSRHTFYQVILNGLIIKQSENFQECLNYVEFKNGEQFKTFELSKSVLNLAAKNNKAVCLDWYVDLYDKAYSVTVPHQATLTIWLNAEDDSCMEGDAVYKVYKTKTGFKAELWDVWTKGLKDNFPQSFEGEKGLKALLKTLG